MILLIPGISLMIKNDPKPGKEIDINNPRTSGIMTGVDLDGVINATEWANATKVRFYLDLDNTIDWNGDQNVDGYNYMYIGKNDTHIHLAVDLCGDQSNNGTDEWFGVWLNTLPRTFSSYDGWHDYINNSVESLCYDVEFNRTHPFFTNELFLYPPRFTNDDTEINPINFSSIRGNYTHLVQLGSKSYDVTSELNGTYNVYRVDFSVDISKWYPLEHFTDLYVNEGIKSIFVSIRSEVNRSVTNHSVVFWDSTGNPGFNDPAQIKQLSKTTAKTTEFYYYGPGNITDNNIIKFSLYGNNSAPFAANITYIAFLVGSNRSYDVTEGYTGHSNPSTHNHHRYSSIKNYHLNYSFGASPNEATGHRMFEVVIPKTELELYDDTNNLGIIIGGYGTAALEMPDSPYWVYQKTYGTGVEDIYYDISTEYYYHDWPPSGPLPAADDDDDDDDAPAIPGPNFVLITIIISLTVAIISLKHRNKLR